MVPFPGLLFLTALLAFYFAWNLGANDVANSMGTSVGSKAITLRQALLIAGVLEFAGAVLFGQNVSRKLATGIVNPALFAGTPEVLLVGMIAVLIASVIWLNVATLRGLPVSSSHAIVGALAGFAWIAAGRSAVDWRTIGTISLTWILTPLASGAIAAGFYSLVRYWVLQQPEPLHQLQEWIPWFSAALLGIFGVLVLPTVCQPATEWLNQQTGHPIPNHDLPLVLGAIGAVGLAWAVWRFQAGAETERSFDSEHALIERSLARFQVMSACCVAFAHGSNDVGNAIAPFAAVIFIQQTGAVPTQDFDIPVWVLLIGGVGIVAGLAVWGSKVIATVGEEITALHPSSGFCAELATAATVLAASNLGLPVSTSHALVGGVVGIGLIENAQSIQFGTIRRILLAWFVTVPVSFGLGTIAFKLLEATGLFSRT